VVKTPAAIAVLSEITKAKSGSPDSFSPAVMPAARNPLGAVTPPGTICHSAAITVTINLELLLLAYQDGVALGILGLP
jgi:hypothetical protein